MKSFQFHFNPKKHDDVILDSFCLEPEKPELNRLGNVYIVGQISNALPESHALLKTIESIVKEEYYQFQHKNAGQALKSALAKANEFLEEESKKGNVNWVGNIDFAILAIDQLALNFAKVGDIKILLARSGEVYDISENLEYQDTDYGSGNTFSNVAVGRLSMDDRLFVMTSDIFEFANQTSLVNDLIEMEKWEDKLLTKSLKPYNSDLRDIAGIMILVSIRLHKQSGLSLPSFSFPKFSLPSFSLPVAKPVKEKSKKPEEFSEQPTGQGFNFRQAALIGGTIILIGATGFLGFKIYQRNNTTPPTPVVLTQTNQETQQNQPEEKSQTASIPSFLEIKQSDFEPGYILATKDNLFFYNNKQKALYRYDINLKKGEVISLDQLPKFAATEKEIAFFVGQEYGLSKYDPKAKKIESAGKFNMPKEIQNISSIVLYQSKFYMADRQTGRILRAVGANVADWLLPNTKRPTGAKSIAIDKNIWVLNKDNNLDRYAENTYKETFKLSNINPPLQNPIKLWASFDSQYLYILEPMNKRLLVVDKKGKLIKQFQNVQWDNLQDFSVDANKNIYLLNGQSVIKISETI